jgi:hypothetical protein
MSFQITTAFVQQFKDNAYHLAQQKVSRARGTCDEEQIVGEIAYFEQIGAVAFQAVVGRHGDTPLISTPHSRRSCIFTDYEWGDMVDDQDKLRLLMAPEGKYTRAIGYGASRTFDDVLFAAALGTAFTGKAAGTSVVLPAAQIIQVTGTQKANSGGATTGLTVGKVTRAKYLMDLTDDYESDRYFFVSPSQLQDLLFKTSATSRDYVDIKALVDGRVSTWMGFNWRFSTRLTLTANTRKCIAWQRPGMQLGVGQEFDVEIGKDPGKRFNTRVYATLSIGATRMEESRVVEVDCDETTIADATT